MYDLLTKIGAIVNLSDSAETLMLRFEVLVSALKVHGYSYGDLSIVDDTLHHVANKLGLEGREILKALADIATKALKAYIEKLDEQAQASIRAKHIDLFCVVLIAFFDDITENVDNKAVI